MSIASLARTAVIVSSLGVGLGATRMLAADGDQVVVTSGTLEDTVLAGNLFHIGEFWIRVPAGSQFQRWLSQGVKRTVVIMLTSNPARFADEKDVRILSGTLMHDTAPDPTPSNINAVGRLPAGDSSIVHELFLEDEVTGTIGAVTFETADFATASKFDVYDNAYVNIVVKIE